MENRNTVILSFDTDFSDVLTITVPRAKIGLNVAQCIAGMDAIMASGAIMSTDGKPIARKKAVYNAVSVNEVALA